MTGSRPFEQAGVCLAGFGITADADDSDSSDEEILLLSGMAMTAFQHLTTQLPDRFATILDEDSRAWTRYSAERVYDVAKSQDLLPTMLNHDRVAWYRQFFRYVYLLSFFRLLIIHNKRLKVPSWPIPHLIHSPATKPNIPFDGEETTTTSLPSICGLPSVCKHAKQSSRQCCS
jgi:hypothetical protein